VLKRAPSRGLTTSMFTDIVGSTATAAELGDQRWSVLQGRHHAIVRRELKRFRGHEVDTAGDGFFATFGVPADGVRCAAAIAEAVQDVGLEIRAGLHTGETDLTGGKAGGIAVNTAARVSALAGAGEVLVTRTVADLVAGSGFTFADRGDHVLKGIPGEWRVLALSGIDGEAVAPVLEPEDASERRARVAGVPLARARSRRRIIALVSSLVVIALVAATLPFILHRNESAGPALAANGIQLIDATSGRPTGSVPLSGTPGGLTSGAGYVWVSDAQGGNVVKVDPHTRAAVDTIPVGAGPAGIAFGDGAVWVALSGAGKLARIDPSTDTVVDLAVGNGPTGLAVDAGSVWVTNFSDDTVVRIDTQANRVVRTVEVGIGPVSVAIGAGGAWVANSGDGTVTRIPLDGEGTTTTRVGNGPSAIAIGSAAVWVANGLDGTLSRIDAGTGAVLQTTPVGDGPADITLDDTNVWVVDHFGGTIARVDAATAVKVGNPIRMVAAPVAIAIVQGELWVAAAAPPSLHRGGTLRFASRFAPDSIDPAVAYSSATWQILSMTNDGLVGFGRFGAPQGGAIVADLASSVPSPSDGGKTYTFQLRPGLHYSNGVAVTPEDFRLGIQRVLLVPRTPVTNYYFDIVGAKGCLSIGSCDLTKGIVTDDASRTVTFHLIEPDPEFLYKLALPFADAVPQGSPMEPIGRTPLPATGPYMIASYTPGPNGAIQLVRNPRFVEWSQSAQPDGYADQIEGTYGVSPARQVSMIEQGQLDAGVDSPPPSALSQLETRYPGQLHEAVQPQAIGFALNTRTAPFDDLRVRRALNFAVNRTELVRIFGGPQLAQVSCQTLPPDYPGYRPYCPYTRHPDVSGAWSAPDTQQARSLVAATGTRGAQVTLWAPSVIPGAARAGGYVVSVLRGLGYRAHLHTVSDLTSYFRQVSSPLADTTLQVSFYGWTADYPEPSDMIVPLFSCLAGRAGLNLSRFCDPQIQPEITEALAIQASDPAAAGAAWERVDRSIVDRAPLLSIATPLQIYFVSSRTSGVQVSPQLGLLLSKLWVV
jgi:YVTN family beta-propeller protein